MPGAVVRGWLMHLCLPALVAAPAMAQLDSVLLQVDREHIGLGGRLRPGTWSPLCLTVENPSSTNRAVYCRWLLEDADGDTVIAQRRVTLNRNRKEFVWLYAAPALTTRPGTRWVLQVVDAEASTLLASETLEIAEINLVGPDTCVLGVLSAAPLGLGLHLDSQTQHEKIRVLGGLSMASLPDRWYGLSIMNTMIWASDGGSPNDAAVTAEIEQSVRQWVHRGGHLVIFVPAVGEPWTGSSLADLLPVTEGQIRRVEGRPPPIVPALGSEEVSRTPITMTVFDVGQTDGVAVLARDRSNNPLIVSGRVGFGNVTLIGLDLADRRLRQMGYPGFNSRDGVWHRVLNWQGPVDRRDVIEAELENRQRNRPDDRDPVNLANFIDGTVAQTGTAAVGILAAIVVFGLYWLMAGPVSYFALKQRSALRYSWLGFVGVVGLFSVVAWGGAFLMQPVKMQLVHFSVIDVDIDSATVHTHGWLSLYVPRFEKVAVALDSETDDGNVISSPGTRTTLEEDRFLDPQSYAVDCAAPSAAEVPFRSTAKAIEIDYVGSIDALDPDLWSVPSGQVQTAGVWPEGRLTHHLPGPLHNVLFVYCPGQEGNKNRFQASPWVWRLQQPWRPGKPLTIEVPMQNASRLIQRTHNWKTRDWTGEGFLGNLIGLKTGQRNVILNNTKAVIADNEMIQQIEMLTFFDHLPPPDFMNPKSFPGPKTYRRRLGRSLDLTRLTTGRRLLIIGHLKQSPLPAPLLVDDRKVTSEQAKGHTVVRWIYDL